MAVEQEADRLKSIARALAPGAFAAVASAVLGADRPALIGAPIIVRLSAHHYDSRTIGMLHVSGQATDTEGQLRAWSCVIKVIDLLQTPRANSFVDAANEVLVYRDGVFDTGEERFRPARCYLISDGPGSTTLLWLEDLTGLQKPPFTLEELHGMAAHLGSWNAHQARSPAALPFEPRSNSFRLRWDRTPAMQQAARLRELHQHRYVRDAYRDVSLDKAGEFLRLVDKLNQKAALFPASLCFGDCNVGNLFIGENETVAVDWASVTRDPLGVDAGCMVGSAICWGRSGAAIAADERSLFETYLASVAASSVMRAAADVRLAYLSLYGFYVWFCAAMPVLLVDEVFPIHLLELRFGARAEEIPSLVSGVIAGLPAYIDECSLLVS